MLYAHLREKVWHHKVIKDRAFWPLGDPISICPRCPTTVPAREIVPEVQRNKKWSQSQGHLNSNLEETEEEAVQKQNNVCYLILKNTSSEANSSSWKMWLGENHKRSRSRKRPKRLQYRGDIPEAEQERNRNHIMFRKVSLCLIMYHIL